MWAMCRGLFSSRCSMSRSISDMARAMRGSSRSGIGSCSGPPAAAADGSLTPRGMAKELICLIILRLPHLGQAGGPAGCNRLERKLKIFRHVGTGEFVNRHKALRQIPSPGKMPPTRRRRKLEFQFWGARKGSGSIRAFQSARQRGECGWFGQIFEVTCLDEILEIPGMVAGVRPSGSGRPAAAVRSGLEGGGGGGSPRHHVFVRGLHFAGWPHFPRGRPGGHAQTLRFGFRQGGLRLSRRPGPDLRHQPARRLRACNTSTASSMSIIRPNSASSMTIMALAPTGWI